VGHLKLQLDWRKEEVPNCHPGKSTSVALGDSKEQYARLASCFDYLFANAITVVNSHGYQVGPVAHETA
jgi:hypothetical protein